MGRVGVLYRPEDVRVAVPSLCIEWIGVPGSGFGPWQNGIAFPSTRSFIDLQLFSPGLRQ